MSKPRVFSSAEKVAILKKHLVEKVPISDLCDLHKLHVNTFYNWLKVFFENGTAAFEAHTKPKAHQADAKDKKIEQLQAQLIRKNEVVAELLEAHTTLKKSLGES
jgi:transposase-like protein